MKEDILTETDSRFPSGPWFGFYRQDGEQSRQRFTLTFRDGRISGGGTDPVSPFHVEGMYDLASGTVRITKSYVQHKVFYSGSNDGDGICGFWEIPYGFTTDSGEFHIWPDELAMEQARQLEAAAPIEA
jgi:hypothetical protein